MLKRFSDSPASSAISALPTPIQRSTTPVWETKPPTLDEIGPFLYIGKQFLHEVKDLGSEQFHSETSAFRAYRWLSNLPPHSPERPRWILCDWHLSDGEGWVVMELIRTLTPWGHLPFLLISQELTKEQKREALAKGVDECYELPLMPLALQIRLPFLISYRADLPKESGAETRSSFQMPFTKRLLDVILGSLALILAAPLIAVIAMALKFSQEGPIFEVSERAGAGYQVFRFYKFRTLRSKHKQKHRFSRWLRRTNLDELPQLVHVLQGRMSLVGNRPLLLEEAEQLTTDEWVGRFLAPAGITGSWQVARRLNASLSSADQRALELNYAKEASFWRDLYIIGQTLWLLMRRTKR
ncbi:MAG: sugar transferase [Bacteroidota bacterium]